LSKEPDVLDRISDAQQTGRELAIIATLYGVGISVSDDIENVTDILAAVALCDTSLVENGTISKWENCLAFAIYQDEECTSASLCTGSQDNEGLILSGFTVDCSDISTTNPNCTLDCDDGLLEGCFTPSMPIVASPTSGPVSGETAESIATFISKFTLLMVVFAQLI